MEGTPGFNSGCTDRREDIAVTSGSSTHIASLTLYGCGAPGGTVTATLLSGGTTVATAAHTLTVIDAPSVSITDLVKLMDGDKIDTLAEKVALPPLMIDEESAAVAKAGYLTHQSVHPTPLELHTVRGFQDAQPVVARRWIAHRTVVRLTTV